MFILKWRLVRVLLLLCFLTLVVGILIGFYHHRAESITAEQLDRQYSAALHPGMSCEEVAKRLAGQGIALLLQSSREPSTRHPTADILHRREDVTFPGWWMDGVGNQTVAECAGLRIEDVFWVVRIVYPRTMSFWGDTEITVYLFFDGEDRLLKYWVNEFIYSL